MSGSINLAPGLTPALPGEQAKPKTFAEKARATAKDFEAMFLNVMIGQMFSGVGQSSFSGGQAAGVWRSMLTDEYAKSFAKKGGIGIADHLYSTLLSQQEARNAASASAAAAAKKETVTP